MAEDYPKHDYRMEGEGLHNVCKWARGADPATCPHIREKRDHSKKIKDSIIDCIGNTPMVRINNIVKNDGIECEVLAKCEFLNPGGSVKDRIGRRMILDAEKRGVLKKGDIIVEPTSGNTGIGLSMTAAARGYRMVICLPEKMSQEKLDALSGLGATLIRTPTPYAFDHLYSHIGISQQMAKDIENCHLLDQYKNPSNPMAHYEETANEIWEQCEGKIDYIFMGAGTVGTACGVSRRLKELDPNIRVIAVDPPGSILAEPSSLHEPGPEGGQMTEGIGYDFIPRVADRTNIDEWMNGPDKESFTMARRLIREEGIMCGGSSGTAMWAACDYIKKHNIGKGKRVVVLLPDNIRNYMTKHLNNDWMYEHGYITEEQCAKAATSDLVENKDWGQKMTVADLMGSLTKTSFVKDSVTCKEALEQLAANRVDQLPVKDASGKVLGVVSHKSIMFKLVKSKVTMDDKALPECLVKDLRHVSKSVTLNELGRVLNRNSYVLIEKEFMCTINDLVHFMSDKMGNKIEKTAESKESCDTSSCCTTKMLAGAAVVVGALAAGFHMWSKKN